MGNRYLITGVQLGLLQSRVSEAGRKELIDDITENQGVAVSDRHILEDVNSVRLSEAITHEDL